MSSFRELRIKEWYSLSWLACTLTLDVNEQQKSEGDEPFSHYLKITVSSVYLEILIKLDLKNQ